MLVLDLILDKSLGATTGTVYVYASGSVAPGQVQVSKSGTYANSVSISVGSFSSFTGMAGYSWRAAISVSSNSSQGWPQSADDVVILTVLSAGGVEIGNVNVTLQSLYRWSFQPGSYDYFKSSLGWVNFYLYCTESFSMSDISVQYDPDLQFRFQSVGPSTALSGYNYCMVYSVRVYIADLGWKNNFFYYQGILIGNLGIRITG